jgi:hypothetical protein
MRFRAPWSHDDDTKRGRLSAGQASALAEISDRLDGLSRKVDHWDRRGAASRDPYEAALDTAIAGLRSVIAHVASADALAGLGGEVRTLAQDVRVARSDDRPGVEDVTGDLERRIGSIADAIASLRAENHRRAALNLESMIGVLDQKIALLQASRASETPCAGADALMPSTAASPDPSASQLDAIETGIADLVRNVQHLRVQAARRAPAPQSPAGEVSRATAEVSQLLSPSTSPAPDAFHAMRGALDDLLARMALLERDLGGKAQPGATPASIPVLERPEHPSAAVPLRQPARAEAMDPAEALLRLAGRTPRWRITSLLAKILLGLAIAAAVAGGLALLASWLIQPAALSAAQQQIRTADRGPRLNNPSIQLDAMPQASAESLAASLPPAIGARLIAVAASGDPAAAYEVGVRLNERPSLGGGEQAVLWLERAAQAGLAPAQLRLAGMYERGFGVGRDTQRARGYYLAAARQGNAKAMHNLAVLYVQGAGGKADYAAAAEWFRKAAAHGLTDSQYNLAVLLERGAGAAQNLPEAYKWYALAARRGDAGAATKRDELFRLLDAADAASVRSAIEGWEPEPQPEDAVTVRTPPGGWDRGPADEAPKVRRTPQMATG